MTQREELRLVIMSATLEAEKFADYFGFNCSLVIPQMYMLTLNFITGQKYCMWLADNTLSISTILKTMRFSPS